MLQLRFGAEDLLGTRFAARPAPLMELGLACATLQRRDSLFDGWRRRTVSRVAREAGPMFELVPSSGAGPLFLDPITEGFDAGVEAVRSSSREFVQAELERSVRTVTPWIRALEASDAEAWQVLVRALRSAFDSVLRSTWPQIEASYRAEVALRSRIWAQHGLGIALAGLHPGSTWAGATLQIPVPSALSIDLAGRGLTLLPSTVWCGRPLVGEHPDGSVLLVYAAATPLPLAAGSVDGDSLAALLGATRAEVLAHTAVPSTTGELARAIGVSSATASVHAKVLRGAGLITTLRDGKAVLHSLTPLGEELLQIGSQPQASTEDF